MARPASSPARPRRRSSSAVLLARPLTRPAIKPLHREDDHVQACTHAGGGDSPGEYNAPLQPTRLGTYTFHFIGAIAGQKVDESFTSSDHTFNDLPNAGEVQFPAKDPSRGAI